MAGSILVASNEQVNLGRLERRSDLRYIAGLVSEGSTVLDLGCGEGDLLRLLAEEKHVIGRGIEIAEEKVYRAIARGLSVLHGDLDEGLGDYPDKSFDYVILSQTLQAVHRPLFVVREMLRVGRQGIVSLPNFGYWRVRWQLLVNGRMPKTEELPYEWYDTPNIHLATVKDFIELCRQEGITIVEAAYLVNGRRVRFRPNLFCNTGIFVLEK